MGKSIIWRAQSTKHEFFAAQDNKISMSVYDDNGVLPILSWTMSPEDAKGIAEILSDLAWDVNREIDRAKEEKEVDNV